MARIDLAHRTTRKTSGYISEQRGLSDNLLKGIQAQITDMTGSNE